VRCGSGPSGTTEAQADSAATTTAKRLALCDVCGIVVRKRDDARFDGEIITAIEAADLQRRIMEVSGGNQDQVKRWLKFAGATTWDTIRRARYEQVINQPELRGKGEVPAPTAPTPATATTSATTSATPAKPCPVPFTEAADWRAAMIEEIAGRWKVTKTAAATIFADMEKKSGKSYLALTPERRKGAWDALTTGKLDKAFKPQGATT
jgi:hypothetical protein